MKFVSFLWRSELWTAAALVTCAVLMAAVAAIGESLDASPRFDPLGSAQGLFAATLLFGTAPALVYGAPAYAFAAFKRWLSWPLVLALGVVPGTILMFFERSFALFFLICGPTVAALTHIYARTIRLRTAGFNSRLQRPVREQWLARRARGRNGARSSR